MLANGSKGENPLFRCLPRFRPSLDWIFLGIVLKEIVLPWLGKKDGADDFERTFADYIGSPHAISVASGRMGLQFILKNLPIPEGAEVILPAFTYWAVPESVRFLNLKPVFVDIDPQTYTMNVSLLEKSITPRTKAILPTHLYGFPCEMDAILEIARKHGLFVVEDCVQAVGAEYASKKIGSMGDAAYFSFGITKNMPLLGGGMVVTGRDDLAQKIRSEISKCGFLDRGKIFKKVLMAIGMKLATSEWLFGSFLFPWICLFNLFGKDALGKIFSEREALDDPSNSAYFKLFPSVIQNQIGLRAVACVEALNARRIHNGIYLQENIHTNKQISLPSKFHKNVFTSFPVLTHQRRLLGRRLLAKGIDTTTGYMKAFGSDCPQAKRLEKEMLHLPVYPSLKDKDLAYLCKTINDLLERLEP